MRPGGDVAGIGILLGKEDGGDARHAPSEGCHSGVMTGPSWKKPARKMVESSLELVDGVETAQNIDRFRILNTGARRAITPTYVTLTSKTISLN